MQASCGGLSASAPLWERPAGGVAAFPPPWPGVNRCGRPLSRSQPAQRLREAGPPRLRGPRSVTGLRAWSARLGLPGSVVTGTSHKRPRGACGAARLCRDRNLT